MHLINHLICTHLSRNHRCAHVALAWQARSIDGCQILLSLVSMVEDTKIIHNLCHLPLPKSCVFADEPFWMGGYRWWNKQGGTWTESGMSLYS